MWSRLSDCAEWGLNHPTPQGRFTDANKQDGRFDCKRPLKDDQDGKFKVR